MTNREKFKDELDEILAEHIAVIKGKPRECGGSNCGACDIVDGNCRENAYAWLNAEYQEPTVDWSKIPIDTPVLVSDDGMHWIRRHFAGSGENGNPEVFYDGHTSWSNNSETYTTYKYIKLAGDRKIE